MEQPHSRRGAPVCFYTRPDADRGQPSPQRSAARTVIGKGLVDQQRMVYRAITTLMAGDEAPVHAIDQLICETP